MIRTYSCCFVNNPRSVFVVHIYNLLIFNSELKDVLIALGDQELP